jgi:hypothetical protein
MISQHRLDTFDRLYRTDRKGDDFKCEKGVACKGRCIPKGHKCIEAGPAGQRAAMIGGGAVAVALAGYLGLESSAGKALVGVQASSLFGAMNSARGLDEGVDSLPIGAEGKSAIKSGFGRIKAAVAGTVLTRGGKLIETDDSGGQTYQAPDGSLATVMNVGSHSFVFMSRRQAEDANGGVPIYEMSFTVNGEHNRADRPMTSGDAKKIIKLAKSSFAKHVEHIPDGTILSCRAHADDGAGTARSNIYQKAGFVKLSPKDPYLWGLKRHGGFSPIKKEEEAAVARVVSQKVKPQ